MLHERDALALDRLRDERLRRVAALAEAGEDPAQRRVVVPVGRLDVPAERAQLRLEVAERDDLLRPLVGLDLVAVDDDPEARRAARGRRPGAPPSSGPPGAPRRPVITTTRPSRPSARFGERDPAALRDAHPERARAGLDPGHADVRVPVEPAEAAEPEQTLARDDAEREERRVQAGHVVALRGEEDVAVGIVEPALGDVELVEQQVDDEVERAERGAEMTRAGALHGDERVQPARVREQRQPSRRGRRRRRAADRARPWGRGADPACPTETVADAFATLGRGDGQRACPLPWSDSNGRRSLRSRRSVSPGADGVLAYAGGP